MEQELDQLRQQNTLQQEVIRQMLSLNNILRQKLKHAGVEIDSLQPFDSSQHLQHGTNGDNYSNKLVENGTKQVFDSTQHVQTGIKKEDYHLPQRIEPSAGNILTLAVELKHSKHMRMSLRNRQRVAKLLIHIYNGGGGTVNDLKHAAGYSKSGMAKLMMNLRKKGIVIKHRVRDHRLSGIGLQLLNNASLK